MAGARPDLGRAGMAPESPWHGEVPLTKDHTQDRCSSAGFSPMVLPGPGQWLDWIRCLCPVWDTRGRSRTWQGALCTQPLPGPRVPPCRGAGKPGPKAIQWDNRWPIVARPNLAAQAGNEQSEHTSAGAKAGGESALHPPWHRRQDGNRHLLGPGLSPQTPWQQPRARGGASNGDFLCFV